MIEVVTVAGFAFVECMKCGGTGKFNHTDTCHCCGGEKHVDAKRATWLVDYHTPPASISSAKQLQWAKEVLIALGAQLPPDAVGSALSHPLNTEQERIAFRSEVLGAGEEPVVNAAISTWAAKLKKLGWSIEAVRKHS